MNFINKRILIGLLLAGLIVVGLALEENAAQIDNFGCYFDFALTDTKITYGNPEQVNCCGDEVIDFHMPHNITIYKVDELTLNVRFEIKAALQELDRDKSPDATDDERYDDFATVLESDYPNIYCSGNSVTQSVAEVKAILCESNGYRTCPSNDPENKKYVDTYEYKYQIMVGDTACSFGGC